MERWTIKGRKGKKIRQRGAVGSKWGRRKRNDNDNNDDCDNSNNDSSGNKTKSTLLQFFPALSSSFHGTFLSCLVLSRRGRPLLVNSFETNDVMKKIWSILSKILCGSHLFLQAEETVNQTGWEAWRRKAINESSSFLCILICHFHFVWHSFYSFIPFRPLCLLSFANVFFLPAFSLPFSQSLLSISTELLFSLLVLSCLFETEERERERGNWEEQEGRMVKNG